MGGGGELLEGPRHPGSRPSCQAQSRGTSPESINRSRVCTDRAAGFIARVSEQPARQQRLSACACHESSLPLNQEGTGNVGTALQIQSLRAVINRIILIYFGACRALSGKFQWLRGYSSLPSCSGSTLACPVVVGALSHMNTLLHPGTWGIKSCCAHMCECNGLWQTEGMGGQKGELPEGTGYPEPLLALPSQP